MKKSKIIIPALGIICLTTAASVSGTVAWFTANNTYNQTIGDFQVARYDGNLSCHFLPGTGTTGNNTVTIGGDTYYESVSVAANALMTNASYDHNNGQHKVYFTTNPSNGFTDVTSVTNWVHGTSTVQQTTYTYYYAVSWTMRFDYAFAGDTASKSLRFDADASSMAKTSGNSDLAGATDNVYKAFRIEMHVGTGLGLVYAGNQESSKCKYVNGTTSSSGANAYANETLADSQDTGKHVIGTFSTSSTSIVVNCVAWFEGSDENVNDSTTENYLAAAYATVRATLAFDVVNAA